jgi:hypothetical protein
MANKTFKFDYKENKLISFLQVFGIILVVFGHSFTEESSLFLNRIIYSFHMPLFVFISGYLFANSMEKYKDVPAKDRFFGKDGFLLKKALRLLVPYFVISSLVFIPKVFLSRFSLRPVTLSFGSYFEMLVYPGKNVIIFFWFLPTIFIISILSYFLWKSVLSKGNLVVYLTNFLIFIALTLYNPLENIKIFNISGCVHYFFFFFLGICLFKYETDICSFLFKNGSMKLFVLAPLHLLSIFIFSKNPFYSRIVVFIAVAGIIESILLGNLYIKLNLIFLDHFKGSTYTIFLFSWFPQVFIQFFVLRYFPIPWYIAAVISTLLGLYIPLLLFKLLNIAKNTGKSGRTISIILGN